MESTIQVTSWNVGNNIPANIPMLNALFPDIGYSHTLIRVATLQEATRNSGPQWASALEGAMGPKYVLKNSAVINSFNKSLILLVFILKQFAGKFRSEATSSEVGFNRAKGGVSVNLRNAHSSLSITGSHLSASDGKYKQRLRDYRDILENTIYPSGLGILNHDYAIWAGDLNFRLINVSLNDAPSLIEKARKSSSFRDKLFELDELKYAQEMKEAFVDFIDSKPNFMPTYKFNIKKPGQYDKERVPAWTDRILYRTKNPFNSIEKIHITSIEYFNQSDHKPVTALYRLNMPLTNFFSKDKQVDILHGVKSVQG